MREYEENRPKIFVNTRRKYIAVLYGDGDLKVDYSGRIGRTSRNRPRTFQDEDYIPVGKRSESEVLERLESTLGGPWVPGFECELCWGIWGKERSDDETKAEYDEIFGDDPNAGAWEDEATVCDDCFRDMATAYGWEIEDG